MSSSFIETKIDVQAFNYILKIGIGTFQNEPPYKEYYLYMDTGSNLVWMQCQGCTKCFKQTPKPFPANKSSSFLAIYLNGTTPKPYNYEYGEGDTTSGILARETFYLRSKHGNLTKIPNIKFGCGLHNDMSFDQSPGNKIAGIMGLGWSDLSFVQQLDSKINGKFSYCLPLVSSARTSNTYLNFGDDCKKCRLESTTKTPLYRLNGNKHYYVNLQGISINKTRLNINPNVFAYNCSSGMPGCIIDMGTSATRVKTPAFEILKQELDKYISRLRGLTKVSDNSGIGLCYERAKHENGVENLPEVTFHFEGPNADFVMKPDAVFIFFEQDRAVASRERLCLAMVRDDIMSILGSHQQVNQKIIYDTRKRELVFYQQDCAQVKTRTRGQN